MSSVTSAVTLATESSDRPVAAAGKNTFPGIVVSSVFDVITTASTVASRLVSHMPAEMTGTGRCGHCRQQSIERKCARRGVADVDTGCARLIRCQDVDPALHLALGGPAAETFLDSELTGAAVGR